MFGALKSMLKRGNRGVKPAGEAEPQDTPVPGLTRDTNGHLKPSPKKDDTAMTGQQNGKDPIADPPEGSSGAPEKPSADAPEGQNAVSAGTAPPTGALNQQVVQATEFSNFETAQYAPTMVATPPELMVGQTTGLAVQDAANYMNAIMQIAVAAQAVAIKKAAENPALAVAEIPLLSDVQKMVTQAVTVYGTVSTTAGDSAKTVISDFKPGS